MSRTGENIYKRKDGRWEGRYMKGRKQNGRIHYGYVYGKNYREVRTLLLPLKQEHAERCRMNGRYSGTLSEWLSVWLKDEVQSRVKPSTYTSYYYKTLRYILPKLGSLPLNQVTTVEVQETIHFWEEEMKLAPTTIQIVTTILKKALQAAIDMGFLICNACKGILLPIVKKRKIGCLSREQQRRIETVAKQNEHGLPTLLALRTGLRIGEIAALRWKDIDLEEQIIHVRHTYQRVFVPQERKTELVLGPTKTANSERKVPFTAEVKKWLKKIKKNPSSFLFSKNEKPMEPRLLTYHFKRIIEQAGDSAFCFHQLRHTFATRCIEAQGDIVSISALLGHSSVKTTLDVYMDSQMEQRRKVVHAMEKKI